MDIIPYLENSKAVAIKVEITAEDLIQVIKNVAEETVKIILSKVIDSRDSDFVPRKQAMTLLNVKSPITMMKWEEKGYLTPHKISGRIFYRKDDITNAFEKFSREFDN